MTEPIRWGIAGTGSIATQFATALANVDDAVIGAVASESAERGAAFAQRFDIETTHVGYDALAADTDIDVVYLASTQDRHLRDLLTFVVGGRNVLCEKPFALNVSQAEQMFAAAAAADVFVMEALWSRFLPSYVKMAELLADGAIGTPRIVEANFSIAVPEPERPTHRLWDPAKGGGAILDLGIYPVQLAHLALGTPEVVHAEAVVNADGIDEQTAIMLRHSGGAMSLLHTAVATRGSCSAKILGTEGTITLAPFFHATNSVRLQRSSGTEELRFPDASLHFQVPEVHRCLREGLNESPAMPHAETLSLLTTLDEVRRQIGVRYPAE
jgi:predicted dehydrogenase